MHASRTLRDEAQRDVLARRAMGRLDDAQPGAGEQRAHRGATEVIEVLVVLEVMPAPAEESGHRAVDVLRLQDQDALRREQLARAAEQRDRAGHVLAAVRAR